jgi:hypothetical protein
MHAQPGVRRGGARSLDPLADHPGIGHADGVGDGDLRNAQRCGLADDGDDLIFRNLTVERATERY